MYMKEHKLETDYESGNIICNETMSKLLGGVASFALEDLPRLVRMHLNPVSCQRVWLQIVGLCVSLFFPSCSHLLS